MKIINKVKSKIYSSLKIRQIFNNEKSNIILAHKNRTDDDNIEYDLRISIHIIEKCFVKSNYNVLKNKNLYFEMIQKCEKLLLNNINSNNNVINEVLSCINLSNIYAKDNNINFDDVYKKSIKLCEKYGFKLNECNDIQISKQLKERIPFKGNYFDFITSRHSIRDFKENIIDIEIVKNIVKLALVCPSACNRQPCKVYYTNNSDKNIIIKKSLADQMGCKNIYNFLVVTVNIGEFKIVGEPFQSYINGGIFLNSLVNSIHYFGLGSCLFQTPKTLSKYDNIKLTLNIPQNEDIVCVVGFGELKNEVSFVQTHRKNVEDIIVTVE